MSEYILKVNTNCKDMSQTMAGLTVVNIFWILVVRGSMTRPLLSRGVNGSSHN